MTTLALIWPFVHPSLAAIALGAGMIPLIVHLLNRQRYRRVPWAAMTFLRLATQRSAARLFMERWLLLLIRILVLVLLGLALARPFFPARRLTDLGITRSHRIIVIDDSLSMRATEPDSTSRFARARQCAEAILESAPENDAVSIVTLAAPAKAVIGHAAYDHRFVRERLTLLEPTQQTDDWTGGLKIALDIFRASPAAVANRFVYIISDFQATTWESEARSGPSAAILGLRRLTEAMPKPVSSLVLIPVVNENRSNVSITKLEAESSLMVANAPVRFIAEVANRGSSAIRGLRIHAQTDERSASGGGVTRTIDLPVLEPGSTTQARMVLQFETPGSHTVQFRLLGMASPFGAAARFADALVDDDERFISIQLRAAANPLLVDGRPEIGPFAGEAAFLAIALAPRVGLTDDVLIQPKIISETELSDEPLVEYDMVAMCNVARLSPELWERLAAFVREGGGLLIGAGDQIIPDHYNRFGFAEGKGIIGGRFLPHESEGRSAVGFKVGTRTSPLVADLANEPRSGFFSARVDDYLTMVPEVGRSEVVLRYTNDEPALLITDYRKGRTAVFTTTLNMDWTNLPAKGDYVSLMMNVVTHLSRRHGVHRNLRVGDTFLESLTAAESAMPIRVTATGSIPASEGRLTPLNQSLAFEYGPIEQSGAYLLAVGSDLRHFVANIDSRESSLRPIAQTKFAEALDRPAHWVGDVTHLTTRAAAVNVTELASTGFYAVLVLLLAEMWLAFRFGSYRWGQSRENVQAE